VPVAPARNGPSRRGPCRTAARPALLRVAPPVCPAAFIGGAPGAGGLRAAPVRGRAPRVGGLRVAPPAFPSPFTGASLRAGLRRAGLLRATWQRVAPLRATSLRFALLRPGRVQVAPPACPSSLTAARRRLAAPGARLRRAAWLQVALLRSPRLRVAPPTLPSRFMVAPLRAGASRVGLLRAGALRCAPLRAGGLRVTPLRGELVRVTQLRAALPRITPLRAGPLRVAGLRRGPLLGTPLQAARRSAAGRAVIVSAGPGIWAGCDRSVHRPPVARTSSPQAGLPTEHDESITPRVSVVVPWIRLTNRVIRENAARHGQVHWVAGLGGPPACVLSDYPSSWAPARPAVQHAAGLPVDGTAARTFMP
jgi:hypothetical protein